MKIIRNQKLFILVNMAVWCAIGALVWLLIGDRLIENDIYTICFIGYPGVLLGLIGGLLYLLLAKPYDRRKPVGR